MSNPDPKPQTELAERTQQFLVTDTKDENQIISEMKGETLLREEYVYSFKQGNRQVTSLSYAGVKEMVRRRGNFQIRDVVTEETEKTIRCRVIIKDLAYNVEFLGANEVEKEKPFAYVLAINKAERNAYMKAMPTKFLAEMVDAFLHSGKPLTPTSTPAAQEKPQNLPQQPPKELLTADQVYATFPADLADMLDFREETDYMILKPRTFLGSEVFAAVKDIVKNLGGEYVSAGKDSHFKIRKQHSEPEPQQGAE